MQIVIDIPDRLVGLDLGCMDIRLHKNKGHVNYVTTDDYERPYFAKLKFAILPKHGRLIDEDEFWDKYDGSWDISDIMAKVSTVLEGSKK